jgi:Ca-activated chloride channel family protein
MPFLRCPLTSDHKVLQSIVSDLKPVGRQEIDGTAIGDALVAAGKRLLSAPEKSRVVILLTDGENNRGQFDPLQASQLLASHKIRVDVVGIGSTGVVPYPVVDASGGRSYQYVHIGFNETALQAIAHTTDGVYYNATDSKGLERVFGAIDRLERSKVSSMAYVRHRDFFLWPVGLALLCLTAESLWRRSAGRVLL